MNAPEPYPRNEKEDSSHPYMRPKDAATLILIDRSGPKPKVLVGRRHDKVVFQPGKFVFPGGRVDKDDSRVPVAAPVPEALQANLMMGSPKIAPPRARALAIAAIREACEETGLCLGRATPDASKAGHDVAKLKGVWAPFAENGLLPDPSGLFLIARAITPAGRVRRFDTRFFSADASAIAHRIPGVVHADAELVELVWVEIGSEPLAAAHNMTKAVLRQLDKRLANGPLRHDAPIPFFHWYDGAMQMDTLTP